MGSQTPRSPTALTKSDGQCCLRHMGKPRHSELRIFRCSLALPTRASTDASPDPSRDPMHGSRARVARYTFPSPDFHRPSTPEFAWRTPWDSTIDRQRHRSEAFLALGSAYANSRTPDTSGLAYLRSGKPARQSVVLPDCRVPVTVTRGYRPNRPTKQGVTSRSVAERATTKRRPAYLRVRCP